MPKHHYNHHTAQQIGRDRRVLDLFMVERHHKTLIKLSEAIRSSMEQYERTLMSSATCEHAARCRTAPVGRHSSPSLLGGLVGETQEAGLSTVGMKLRTVTDKIFSQGDVVYMHPSGSVGVVVACMVSFGGAFQLRVRTYQTQTQTRFHVRCRPTEGEHEEWCADSCWSFSAWYWDGDVLVALK